MTVDRFIKSTARVEYSAFEWANRRNRPRLIIGAVSNAALATTVCFSTSRRLIDPEVFGLAFVGWFDIQKSPHFSRIIDIALHPCLGEERRIAEQGELRGSL
jgi:hypothetical protein